MKGSAEILVLGEAGLAAQVIELLRGWGHNVFAHVHDLAEAMALMGQRATESGAPGRPAGARPGLALIDLAALARDPAADEGMTAFLRGLDVPAVYVAARADDLAPAAGLPRGGAEGHADADERITATLAPRELSLAMELALCRHARKREARRVSEARYKAIIEDQTEFICRFLADGTVTFVNEACCRYLGKHSGELIGSNRMRWVFDEDLALIRRMLGSLSPEQPVVSYEHRIVLPGGTVRWNRWTSRLILNEVGEAIEYQAVGHDITERKQAEDALRRSEERYESIFQRAAVPLWEEDISDVVGGLDQLRAGGVTDFGQYFAQHPEQIIAIISRTRFADINDQGLKLFGAGSREEMVRSHREIFLPESVPVVGDMLVSLAEGKSHHECEITLRTLQGEPIVLLMRVSFPSAERGLENMLLSCVDITERKRAEDKITRLNADLSRRATELQAANTELESFSYSVSHDLRAPLRAIDGFSMVVMEDYAAQLGERGKGYLERVRQASQRMSRLIDDLLDLSRMTRSAMHLQDCDLSAMADAVVGGLRKAQPERVVDVVIDPDMRVHADPNLLRVVLENLLGNAWKFTSRQDHAHIHLGTTSHDGRAAYFVRDDGAGFDMAHVEKLFGAFQRLHGVHEFDGTGIGLATVRRIIRRHGGEVWAEGKEGAGATFTFTLS